MSITPYLLYEDVASALKFLARAFGFRKYGAQMSRPDGKINHAAMKLGDDLIMMGYPGPKYKNPKRLGHRNQHPSRCTMLPELERRSEFVSFHSCQTNNRQLVRSFA